MIKQEKQVLFRAVALQNSAKNGSSLPAIALAEAGVRVPRYTSIVFTVFLSNFEMLWVAMGY
ncbi:MAG: hypothetical protein COV70_02425 [Parcubacteria group bacterium CG11_big_fil_rev_8_21_14_0_20_39_22]|nr:MAG: hypothetical protein COV70_02425 [Parcubacteria group bacterium CG11_big_fil_rev_8_21_14_0_20_39_22]